MEVIKGQGEPWTNKTGDSPQRRADTKRESS
jgi:hypothetical protein